MGMLELLKLGRELANSLVVAARSSVCLLPKGRGTELGFERYLSGHDAIYADPTCWSDPDPCFPTDCSVAP